MTTKRDAEQREIYTPPLAQKMEEPGALDPGLPSGRPWDPSSDTGSRSPKGRGPPGNRKLEQIGGVCILDLLVAKRTYDLVVPNVTQSYLVALNIAQDYPNVLSNTST